MGDKPAHELSEGDHPGQTGVRLYYTAVTQATAPFEARLPQLSRWRRMQIPAIAAAVYAAIRLIGPTLRTEMIGVQNAIQIRNSGAPGIGAFWHRCIFPAVWIWRNRGIVVLNTVNFDGQWTRSVIERLGFGTAQGSSTRGGVEGLAVMAQRLEEGKHVAFTIDGPHGPRYVAKPGAVILARRTGRPISVFHIGVQRGFTFVKSWDLFRLPLPFSRTVMVVAPPIEVSRNCTNEEMQEKLAEMQVALERVRDVAEAWFDLSDTEQDRLRVEWSQRGSSGASPNALPRREKTS